MAGWKDPEHRLDKTRLIRLFKQLDVHLGIAKANRPAGTTQSGPLTIVVCGGAAMCFKNPERGTGDIDIIYPRMPPELDEAAREVRKLNRLPADWLNDAPQTFADHPFSAASETLHHGPNLIVLSPDDGYLLGMKVQAARRADEGDTLWLMNSTGSTRHRDLKRAAQRVANATATPWKQARVHRAFIKRCVKLHKASGAVRSAS